MEKKGISPLVASVLLIAFTLAIAGIMATWSTSFVRGRTTSVSSQADCIGALDIEVKGYQSSESVGNITVIIKNMKATMNLSDISISAVYSSAPFSNVGKVKDLGGNDPIGPLGVTGVSFPLSEGRCPDEIKVVSLSCPDFPQEKRRSAGEITC